MAPKVYVVLALFAGTTEARSPYNGHLQQYNLRDAKG